MSDNPETQIKPHAHADNSNAKGLAGQGGDLLTQRHTETKENGHDSHGGKNSEKSFSPTKADLLAENSKEWNTYAKDQTARREKEHQANPYMTDNRDEQSPKEYAASRKEADAKALSKLTDHDLKVVGDVTKALAGPNPTEKALEVIKNAYDKNYPADRIEGIDTAMRLNLERTGLSKNFYMGFSMGPEGALASIQDKRAAGPGTFDVSYSAKIGKFQD